MINVIMTRTIHGISAPCRGTATCPADRYVVTISLKDADIGFSDARRVVVQGQVPAGTVYVAAPANEIGVAFAGPCDLLHLSILKSFVDAQLPADRSGAKQNRRELDRLVFNDPVIEQLGRLLCDGAAAWPADHVESLSRLVIARILRFSPRRETPAPLPLWRLRKVEALIESDIAAPLRLRDLAAVAGLSRMHFAAQFRAATGHRPHEYVLMRRIERAKALIEENEMSLVEIALDAGFQSQAHFCTIFKRLTGATPSSWRHLQLPPEGMPAALFARGETPRPAESGPASQVGSMPMGARFSHLHSRPRVQASALAGQGLS